MSTEVRYRTAGCKDLPAMAEVFLTAFPESVAHYVGHPISPRVIEDAFAIVIDAEPGALIIAEYRGNVAGYIIAPSCFSCIVRTAIVRGHVLKLLWRWISGQYGVGLRPASIAIRNWLSLVREARSGELHADARILSVAVSPDCQGMGMGTDLMKHGLDYLRSRGSRLVRLEVRPGNHAAVHVYEKLGFVTRGSTQDTQGQWLIMLLQTPEEGHA